MFLRTGWLVIAILKVFLEWLDVEQVVSKGLFCIYFFFFAGRWVVLDARLILIIKKLNEIIGWKIFIKSCERSNLKSKYFGFFLLSCFQFCLLTIIIRTIARLKIEWWSFSVLFKGWEEKLLHTFKISNCCMIVSSAYVQETWLYNLQLVYYSGKWDGSIGGIIKEETHYWVNPLSR